MELTIVEDGDVVITFTVPETQTLVINGEGSGGGGVSSWNDLTDKPTTFPPSTHTHDDRYFTESEVTTALAGKSDTAHTHDDRYYTESETDTLLAAKAASSHTHTVSNVTNLQALLDAKADSIHTHAYSDLTGKPTLPLSLNVKKTTLTGYTNTTFTDDPELFFVLPIGEYDFETLVLYEATTANDFKMELTFSGTATAAMQSGPYFGTGGTAFTTSDNMVNVSTTINVATLTGFDGNLFAGGVGIGNILSVKISGRIYVTASGTLRVRCAKNANTDTTTDTNAMPNSFISAVEVLTSP